MPSYILGFIASVVWRKAKSRERVSRLAKAALGKIFPTSLQFGALPYRFGKDGELEILLITTRRSKRWIIPKGAPIKGLKPSRSAAQEAFEEAGVRGSVSEKPFGDFRFRKTLEGAPSILCQGKVFPLEVKTQMRYWPEAQQRAVAWISPEEACARLNDDGLRLLVARFAAKTKPKRPNKKARVAASPPPFGGAPTRQAESAHTETG